MSVNKSMVELIIKLMTFYVEVLTEVSLLHFLR